MDDERKNGLWICHTDYSISLGFDRKIEKITSRQTKVRGLVAIGEPRIILCDLEHYVSVGKQHRAIGKSREREITVPTRARAVVFGEPCFEEKGRLLLNDTKYALVPIQFYQENQIK